MHKDIGPKPMEPFTRDEEKELVERLDALSLASLESYIASARSAFANKGLSPTWRPRIEFGAHHAEQALSKAQSAAASDATAPPPAATPSTSKAKKAAAIVADTSSEQETDEE
jgi:hypothetical protein